MGYNRQKRHSTSLDDRPYRPAILTAVTVYARPKILSLLALNCEIDSYTTSEKNMASDGLGIQGFLDSKRYEKVRPLYPKEAVKTLMIQLGVLSENGEAYSDKTFNILELGAGTGKFTRVMVDVLKDANVRIIASDPVKNMCDQFKEVLPEIEIKQFSAENIDLEDETMDVVLSANAFHWFGDRKESLLEISRVLAPRGMLGLVWCYPDGQSQPWMQEIWKYLDVPYLKQNSFGIPPLHQEEILNVIPLSGKFGKLERGSSKMSVDYSSSTRFSQYLSSASVLHAATPQERADFEIFYKGLMKKYFGKEETDPTSVDFIFPLYWCQKV